MHLHDVRLLPRISMDPRECPQGNWPGDKMYQSQLSSPVPEAELRSGVALPVTLVCIKFPHPNPNLGKLETSPLPVPFQLQPTR